MKDGITVGNKKVTLAPLSAFGNMASQKRKEEFIQEWNSKMNMSLETVMREIASKIPGDKIGIALESGKIRAATTNVTISVDVAANNGNQLYRFSRTLYFPDSEYVGKSVYHSIFVCEQDAFSAWAKQSGYRGHDPGKPSVGAMVGIYDHVGIKEIRVHANINMGGYSWHKYGFKCEDRQTLIRTAKDAQSTFSEYLTKLDTAKIKYDKAEMDKIQKIIDMAKAGDIKAMWALVDCDYSLEKMDGGIGLAIAKRNGRKPNFNYKDLTVAKVLCIGSDWLGNINMEDPDQNLRLRKYLGLI